MSDLLHKGLHTLLCVFCLEITLKMNSCSLLSLRSRQGSHRWRICSQTCVMDDVCCSCWSSWLDISWYDHVHSRACPESEVALKAISSFVMSTTYYEGNNLCFRKWLLLCQLLTLADRNEWKCRFFWEQKGNVPDRNRAVDRAHSAVLVRSRPADSGQEVGRSLWSCCGQLLTSTVRPVAHLQ